MRILIADDDPISRRLLEATLARLGHQVVAVTNGIDAVAALGPDGPRLAILDWMMPGMDGLAVCRALRARTGPYVYVILLTSRDRREDLLTGLEAEADDFLTKPFDAVELRSRLLSGERVLTLQAGLLSAQDALRHEATHDRLTGLWNRGMILDQLGRELHRVARTNATLSVVVADIDRFKSVNDTFGHAAGDDVLRHTAQRMRSVVRDYDYIGRYGGEEFLFVLSHSENESALQIAERARAAVAHQPVRVGEIALAVTVSLGVASSADVGHDPAALIEAADAALYRAKAGGRNRVEQHRAKGPGEVRRTDVGLLGSAGADAVDARRVS